jgi:hypothetical protein
VKHFHSMTPPPHKDLPQSPPRPLDSPNWCMPSPSPPPQSPPPSPTHQSHPPKTLPILQLHHTESQVVPKLFSIIKTASDTLQSIVRIAEKLICQVNAEHRLAHKPQKIIWSSCKDAHGNLCCSQPPKFLSWRGAPEVLDSIA